MRLMPRGVNLEHFAPRFRDPRIWGRYGLGDELKFLFVGRISKEKNLDVMLEAFLALRDLGEPGQMILVGDGPYREELERRYASPQVLFTGTLQGRDLAAAYASSDLFVFPSRTDTFGNVVLEAQASGLPAIVSDRCGAHEIVAEEAWGTVVDTALPGPLAEAMAALARDPARRRALRRRALETVGVRSHERWAEVFWNQILGIDDGVPTTGVAANHGSVPD
jgi:glycosyltransferase involved in cell wall biosynthesis